MMNEGIPRTRVARVTDSTQTASPRRPNASNTSRQMATQIGISKKVTTSRTSSLRSGWATSQATGWRSGRLAAAATTMSNMTTAVDAFMPMGSERPSISAASNR